MNAVHLRRIDPARNMHRFYRLDVQPDLFGGVLLVKKWGRVGTHGRMMAESYESEDLAIVALQRQAEFKRRPGLPVREIVQTLNVSRSTIRRLTP
jgi:predicted DNA-binding WGR domain protein